MAAAVLAIGVVVGRAELVFKGVMVANDEPAFSLYSTGQQTRKWVQPGQSFDGAKRVGFDPRSETLSETRQSVRLQPSLVRPGSTDSAIRLKQVAGLEGLELADELATQGDEELAKLLARRKNLHPLKRRTRQTQASGRGARRPREGIKAKGPAVAGPLCRSERSCVTRR
ncbi:MAG TPA: hypothetical protein VHO24_01090 [Opitutaceae bacterium]|nr:hypothetical protein [Opitutaceae bacterium]